MQRHFAVDLVLVSQVIEGTLAAVQVIMAVLGLPI